jgi:hypothetical protein
MAQSPEQQKQYHVTKSFKALNTKANRTAIDESEFSWIENVQPIGFGNLKVVPQSSNIGVTWSNTVTELTNVNINNTDYILAFQANGGAEAYNLNSNSVVTIATAGTFTGSGVRAKQWKDERAIISDPNNGYYTWDGANLITIGSVGGIGITNVGSGYTEAPIVTISAPNQANGKQATAVASISNAAGTVLSVLVTANGSGYTTPPTVTFEAPKSQFGVQAQGSASIQGGNVVVISVTNPGSGYTSAPNVTITGGGGNNAAATAILGSGIVTAITLTEAGSGYTTTPSVTISGGGGSGATAVAGFLSFAKGTVGVLVTAGGSGYTSPPAVTISGGGGANANAVAIVNGGAITSVVVDNPGSGYTSNPTVSFTGGGGNGASATAIATVDQNVDIASFQGRVWIAQGRTVFYSAAGLYNDFVGVSAGNINLADDTLHSNIKSIISANNFLYVFGENSINVFSDVRVSTTGATLFTNTNVSASVGSRRIDAIFPYFRSLLFANDYGIYALVGATTSKLSDALDGIYPLFDFTKPVTGGQVLLNNILCAAFQFWYNDPVQGLRPIQCVFFDKKWFITSQGTLNYLTSLANGGGVFLYGTNQRNLLKLYNDPTANIATYTQTALWPMGDVIRDKQALKWGLEAILGNNIATLTITIDNETGLGNAGVYTATNFIPWVNNLGQQIDWENDSGQTIGWLGGLNGFWLYKGDAQQYGKYLGFTVTSNSANFVMSTFEFEYERRARF